MKGFLRKTQTSPNIIFKQRLLWSLGLRDAFQRGISADNPFGVHEYRNVRRKSRKAGQIKQVKVKGFIQNEKSYFLFLVVRFT